MLCLKCYKDNEFVFCSDCTPKWGDRVNVLDKCVFVGDIDFWQALKAFFSGRKVVKWWCGSDLLVMIKFPPGRGRLAILKNRLKMLLLEPFIFKHWVNGAGLLKAINQVPFISKKKLQFSLWVGKDTVVEKQPHQGFNVCYYAPSDSEYTRWVYGLDIIAELILSFPEFNWIKLDGKFDMASAYAYMDVYIRPSRWDGYPRMVREAGLNNIPVIFSEQFDLTVEKCARRLSVIYREHQRRLNSPQS